MAQKKAKIGRPKLPKGEAKGKIVPVRFAKADLKAIAARARANKQTVSDWIRSAVMQQASVNFDALCPKCGKQVRAFVMMERDELPDALMKNADIEVMHVSFGNTDPSIGDCPRWLLDAEQKGNLHSKLAKGLV